MKYDRQLGGAAADVPAKFQSGRKSPNPNLVEISRDLAVRRPSAWWLEALIYWIWCYLSWNDMWCPSISICQISWNKYPPKLATKMWNKLSLNLITSSSLGLDYVWQSLSENKTESSWFSNSSSVADLILGAYLRKSVCPTMGITFGRQILCGNTVLPCHTKKMMPENKHPRIIRQYKTYVHT